MRKFRFKPLIAALCLAFLCFSVTAAADTGPKPAVYVTFENLPEGECYATLLSETKSSGPASAEGDAMNGFNLHQGISREAWLALVEHQDPDGYYFLHRLWAVSETQGLDWTYYPPAKFKVCLYYPETGRFYTSAPMSRYAFYASYKVDMKETADDATLTVRNAYNYGREVLLFFKRLGITLAAEIVIGLLFGLRKKRQILIILITNLITQSLLNLCLFYMAYRSGPRASLVLFFFAEIAIIIVEALTYVKKLGPSVPNRRNSFFWLYALAANAASFALGLFL